jgi:uncharacterized damage-inducible protein DinB
VDLGTLISSAVGSLLERDLAALRREVEAFPEERGLWARVPGVSNSAGTLVLHLAGNLQHFFGARLGKTGYVRDRPAEFSRQNVPRAELLREIDSAAEAVRAGLARLTPAQLAGDFPETVGGARLVTGEYLIHLTAHFAYHLGQVDYLRRVITGSDSTVGAMRPEVLSSARAVRQEA